MFGKGESKESDVAKGLAAGVIGGLVATAVMTTFQNAWKDVAKTIGGEEKKESGDSNPTVTVASRISEGAFGHRLAGEEKEMAGLAVHYSFGTLIGALYGVAAELLPPVTAGAGSLYGAGVWLGADEGTLPALGLSKPPSAYPPSTHAYGLAAHLVYGVTAELVRRVVRPIL